MTIFKNVTTGVIQANIRAAVVDIECQSVRNATKGIIDEYSDEEVFDLMFIHTFIPFWCKDTVGKVKCLLAEKYNIK